MVMFDATLFPFGVGIAAIIAAAFIIRWMLEKDSSTLLCFSLAMLRVDNEACCG